MELTDNIEVTYDRPLCECGTMLRLRSPLEIKEEEGQQFILMNFTCDNQRCPKGITQQHARGLYNPIEDRPGKIPSNHYESTIEKLPEFVKNIELRKPQGRNTQPAWSVPR